MSYYLRLLDARGGLVESFAPASLSAVVRLAADKVADFDKYATVYRVIRLTNGLYARPFMPVPPEKVAKRKKPVTSLIVHIVSADLYHLDQKPI
jgi:hypothetical protein